MILNSILTIALSLSSIFLAEIDSNETSNDSGIVFFKGTWDEVLAEAEKQDKPIFLDAYATWCGPCKWLKSRVFPNAEVGKYFNEHFINYEMDMEKGSGSMVARQYRVSAYPTLIFVNADGSVIKKAVGYHEPEQLIALGQQVISLKTNNN